MHYQKDARSCGKQFSTTNKNYEMENYIIWVHTHTYYEFKNIYHGFVNVQAGSLAL